MGNLTQLEERDGDEWTYVYDELNQLRLQTLDSGVNLAHLTYRYNENGQRMSVGRPLMYGVTP